jgi:ribosomal-protein-alanine N-acetyltransferase
MSSTRTKTDEPGADPKRQRPREGAPDAERSRLLIETERLELVAGTPEMARAELDGVRHLAPLLNAEVPASWPPELYDEGAIRYSLARMEEAPEAAGWWLWYFVLRAGDAATPRRVLVGVGGFKGPPSDDGTVEIGYSIVSDYQRRGYASEAVRGFVAHAFALPSVRRVIAETLPDLAASIGVLERSGFTLIGAGSEPGVIRYELRRPGAP